MERLLEFAEAHSATDYALTLVPAIYEYASPPTRYWVAKELYAQKPSIRHISQLDNGNWATDPHNAAKLRAFLDELW